MNATHILKITIEVLDLATAKLGLIQTKVANLNTMFKQLTTSQLMGHGKTLAGLNRQSGAMELLTQANRNAVKSMFQTTNTVKQLGNVMDKSRGAAISLGMSMLFGGMALKRVAEGALRAMVNTYMQMTDNNTEAHTRVMELSAAFEFLKYSMFDAIMGTDVFMWLIDNLISAFNWISQFVQQHPKVARMIAIFLSVAIALGTVAMVAGQLYLLAFALNISLLSLAGIIFVIAGAMVVLVEIWTTDWSNITKIVMSLIAILVTVIAVMVIMGKGTLVIKAIGIAFNWLAKNPIVLLILAIITAIGVLSNMATALGGWGNLWKSVWTGMAKVTMWFVSNILDYFLEKFRSLLALGRTLANLVGLGGIADQMEKAREAIYVGKSNLYSSWEKMLSEREEMLGVDKMRDAFGNSNILMSMLTGSKQEGLGTTDFSYLNTEANEQKDIAQNTKLDDETIAKLKTSLGKEFGDVFERIIANNVTIIPSTQG